MKIIIIKILRNVQNQPNIIELDEFQIKYALLVEDLCIKAKGKNSILSIYWKGIYLYRWAATIGILVCLKDYN